MQSTPEEQAEQSAFGAEDENWKRPIPIPREVLEILRSSLKASADELQRDWLLASEVHLDGAEEIDLVLMGVRGLRGAHSVPYWLFRKNKNGYDLLLSTGGDSFKILPTKWKGHCVIEVLNHTVDQVTKALFRFDGQRYREYRHMTEPIR